MTHFLPLDTPKAWGIFNAHLGNASYVGEHQPSAEDVEVYKAVKPLGGIPSRCPHVLRWFNHLTAIGMDPSAWPAELRVAMAPPEDEVDADAQVRDPEEFARSRAPTTGSAVVLDVKPWEEDTDMKELEAAVRAISLETLEWKASELVPIVGKLCALRILCHFTDDMFAVEEDLKMAIESVETVSSVEIFAWNRR